MELPNDLKINLCTKTEKYKISELKLALSNITSRYMDTLRSGDPLLNKEVEAVAYANSRMAATYNSVYSVMKQALIHIPDDNIPRTLLDVGAGTGSATWAINELINLNDITLLEAEDAMLNLGKDLMASSDLENAKWKKFNLKNDKITDKADLVVASYMINELPQDIFEDVISEMWYSANKYLVLIEPGTMQGFNNIKKAKEILLKLGANIMAPCTSNTCHIGEDDWCHFTTRVQRTKIHKELKEGDVPYEDEKFSYIVLSKTPCTKAERRILRHPIIEPGKITLSCCTPEENKNIIITKKDDLFKTARKSNAGDEI